MLTPEIVRKDIPLLDVFVVGADQSLSPASQMLTEDITADLQVTRSRILDAFGVQDIPFLSQDLQFGIENYFSSRKWDLPKSVLIDPEDDAPALRQILQAAKFPSVHDQEFFTGMNGHTTSAGGCPQLDLVFFHDNHAQHRKTILDTVNGWGEKITEDSLYATTERHLSDLIVHELAHLAGGLAVTAITVEEVEGALQLTGKSTAGFIDIHDDVPLPTITAGDDYYTGPALDESWAAVNSSLFQLSILGCTREEIPVDQRFGIVTELFVDGDQNYYPVSYLHSAQAGAAIEDLDQKYPGVMLAMTQAADKEISIPTAISTIKSLLPANVFKLLNTPTYAAWQKLERLVCKPT
jgi:hypothetical protein